MSEGRREENYQPPNKSGQLGAPRSCPLKPSRLEGRVLNTGYPERVSGLLRECKYPVNSLAFLDSG
jgi:hypothetical protein